jgi:ABC-type transporter Mla MlaB component
MLKISRENTDGSVVVLRLEGEVTDRWVDALEIACADISAEREETGATLALDLTRVSFLDARGVTLLQSLARRGVELAGGSVFVAEQLRHPRPVTF